MPACNTFDQCLEQQMPAPTCTQHHAPQVALSKKSPYTASANRVSGLMLANHTSIRHLFNRCLAQYDKLMKRKAFLDNYKDYPIFQNPGGGQKPTDSFEEFDDARDVVASLSAEYEACESPDYVRGRVCNWWFCVEARLTAIPMFSLEMQPL